MDNKIVKVIFKEGWETMYSNDLTKCDYGQVLQIEGITLPEGNVEVHFSLTEHNGEAPISIGSVKDNIITVDIPDFIFQKKDVYTISYEAYAWIYVTDGESGRTIRKIVFTIDTRAEPSTNIPEDQKDKFLQEVRQVMAETKEVAQSVRDDADNGKFNGQQGDPGKDGKSAYQYAVEGGFKGTEQEFIDSMGKAGQVDLTGYVTKDEHEAELLKAFVKVTTDKAPYHHITDSASMKVVEFGMEGITEQDTIPGNQLFDISKFKSSSYEVNNGDGSITLTSYAPDVVNNKISECIPTIKVGDTIIFSHTVYFGGDQRASKKSLVITQEMLDNDKFTFYGQNGNSAYTISDIMINKGDTLLPYEPFVGGMPSPNPEHEEEITLAGVLNEETGRYEHKLWVYTDNHFDIDRMLDVNEYISFEVTGVNAKQAVVPYMLKPNTTYVIHANKNNATSNLRIYANSSRYVSLWNTNDARITTLETGMLYVGFYSTSDKSLQEKAEAAVGIVNNGTYTDIQINEGSTVLPSQEFGEQRFTLTSDRPLTMWDYKAKRDGLHGWSIWSGEYVLNSTKNYNVSEWGDLVKFAVYGVPTISNRNEAVCEQFRFVSNPQTLSPQQEAIDWTGTTLQVWLHKDRGILDAESFKAYLEENPIKIRYHASEEQAFIPLPEEEQTLLNNLETYYGVTNVYNEQGCPISITYCADQELHWSQKLLQIQQAII